MERFDIDAAEAFELLRQLSQHSNMPIAQLAQRVVGGDTCFQSESVSANHTAPLDHSRIWLTAHTGPDGHRTRPITPNRRGGQRRRCADSRHFGNRWRYVPDPVSFLYAVLRIR
ncbi:MAG TPA: ANTAR domain-containing protein [Mycobacterium sp.]|uniref:ANTAR domain-containing protein n=1 Tax=Mycobacterium sp. TaxID=1785 RepID=UPI002F3F09F2